MHGRQKAGKAFLTLDDAHRVLPPVVVQAGQTQVACLALDGRLLVFALDELKRQANGGKGLTLMDVDAKIPLVSVGDLRPDAQSDRQRPRRQTQGGRPESRGAAAACRQARAQGAQGRRPAEGAARGGAGLSGPAASTPPAGSPSPLWRQREFMLLWSGMLVSTLGSNASAIVYPLLILALTQSPMAVGVATALRVVPFVLLCLPVGALVNRRDRRRLMLRCELGRGLAVASLPLAMAFAPVQVAHIYAVMLIEGVLMVFYNLAEVAALPRVVGTAQLPQAMAQNHAGFSGAEIAGPALGTALYSLWRGLPFVADALSFLASAWTLWRLQTRFDPPPRATERRDLLAEVRRRLAGFEQAPRTHMAPFTGLGNFVHSAVPLLLIVIAKQQGASESQIGLVFSLAGLGGLLGAMVGGVVQRRFTRAGDRRHHAGAGAVVPDVRAVPRAFVAGCRVRTDHVLRPHLQRHAAELPRRTDSRWAAGPRQCRLPLRCAPAGAGGGGAVRSADRARRHRRGAGGVCWQLWLAHPGHDGRSGRAQGTAPAAGQADQHRLNASPGAARECGPTLTQRAP